MMKMQKQITKILIYSNWFIRSTYIWTSKAMYKELKVSPRQICETGDCHGFKLKLEPTLGCGY